MSYGSVNTVYLIYNGVVISVLPTATGTFDDNNWHSFVLLFAAGQVQFYLDGVVQSSATYIAPPQFCPAGPTTVGATVTGGFGYRGSLFQALFSNRLLGDNDIADHTAAVPGGALFCPFNTLSQDPLPLSQAPPCSPWSC